MTREINKPEYATADIDESEAEWRRSEREREGG